MDKEKKLEVLKNSAVQAHISMLQGIINRMAGNSANCKNWTVTLVAAMLVLLVDKDMQIPNAWICLIPVALFYLLDCYYLGLERLCISSQKAFLERIYNNEEYVENLYSHPLKTIFQHKACTDKLYADSFYKVQKNSHSSFEVICCRR